jgi:hypothetical protein
MRSIKHLEESTMLNQPNELLVEIARDEGLILAGGIWGQAYWKKINKHYGASIAEAEYDGTDIATSVDDPWQVQIYPLRLDPEWKPEDGEAPEGWDEHQSTGMQNIWVREGFSFRAPNLYTATDLLDAMVHMAPSL